MVPSFSRRQALRSAGIVVGAGLAGCLSIGSGERIVDDRVVWQRSIDQPPTHPVLADGTLYVSSGFTTYALSGNDGSEEWTIEHGEPEHNSPDCLWDGGDLTIADGRLYATGCDHVTARSPSDGAELWTDGPETGVPIAVGGGTAYAYGDALVALDAATGEEAWREWLTPELPRAPAATEDGVVIVDRDAGLVSAYSREGRERWTYRTDAETRAPTIDDGVVYVATAPRPGQEGRFFALALSDGTVHWEAETPAPDRGSRPIVDEDTVYFGCTGIERGQLVALDRRDGSKRWAYTAEAGSVGQPHVGSEGVFVGSNDDTLYAFSRGGEHQWQVDAEYPIGVLAVGDGRVYAAMHSQLFAVEAPALA